jgi:hypothetical protein
VYSTVPYQYQWSQIRMDPLGPVSKLKVGSQHRSERRDCGHGSPSK